MTGADRIGPPAGPPATAAPASALPRRTAAGAHDPASGGPGGPAHPARPEGAGATPDPHGVSGRLVDVFA